MKKVCTEKAWRHVLSMAWRTPFPRSRLPANIEKFNEAIECVEGDQVENSAIWPARTKQNKKDTLKQRFVITYFYIL